MRQWLIVRREATANDSSSSKVHRREGCLALTPIKKDGSMYSSPLHICLAASRRWHVAALALANCNWHVAEANISRPHPPAPSVLCTVPKLKRLEW
jgi:hypothetical protein